MTNIDTRQSIVLEEYKTLRQEILSHIDGGYKHLNVVISINTAILGIIGLLGKDWVQLIISGKRIIDGFLFGSIIMLFSIVSLGLNWNYIKGQNGRSKSIAKIATYLKIFLEPKLDGLHWEKNISLLEKTGHEDYQKKHKGESFFKSIINSFRIFINVAVLFSLLNVVIFVIISFMIFISLMEDGCSRIISVIGWFVINLPIYILLKSIINDAKEEWYFSELREHFEKKWNELVIE